MPAGFNPKPPQSKQANRRCNASWKISREKRDGNRFPAHPDTRWRGFVLRPKGLIIWVPAAAAESWGMTSVRLIKHEVVPECGSYEVRFPDDRPSRYFYWMMFRAAGCGPKR